MKLNQFRPRVDDSADFMTNLWNKQFVLLHRDGVDYYRNSSALLNPGILGVNGLYFVFWSIKQQYNSVIVIEHTLKHDIWINSWKI